MKNLIVTLIFTFLYIPILFAQSYEIQVVDDGNGTLSVQLRETTGTDIPTTDDHLTDLVFGLQWNNSCGATVGDITTNYNITKSGGENEQNGQSFQALYANNTPFQFPNNWTVNEWATVATITYTGSCDFAIAPTGFYNTTDPNIGVNLEDYEPTVVGNTITPPPCPESSDITPVNSSESNCSNEVVPLINPTVDSEFASQTTFTWEQNSGLTATIFNDANNPSIILPTITGCDPATIVVQVTVGCTEDANVALNGGQMEFTVYPMPEAPTVERNDETCSYTIMTACPNDITDPATISNQQPDTDGFTQTFTVSNAYCNTAYDVDVEECPDATTNSCAWELSLPQTPKCTANSWEICVKVIDDLIEAKGVDFKLDHPNVIRATGVVTLTSDLANANDLEYTINSKEEEVYIDVHFKETAPASASLNGTGVLACIEFQFTEHFNDDWQNIPITSDQIIESYTFAPTFECLDTATTNIAVDFQAGTKGQLSVWGDESRHLVEPNPAITTIIVKDAQGNPINTLILDEMGKFLAEDGASVQLTRIQNNSCNGLFPVITSYDAYLASLVITSDTICWDIQALVALDVNNDGFITSGDVTEILRRKNGLICNYTVQAGEIVSDWKFEIVDTVLYATAWQLDANCPEDSDGGADRFNVPVPLQNFDLPTVATDSCGYTSLNFAAILKGDGDNSWNQQSHANYKSTVSEAIELNLDNGELKEGQWRFPVYYRGEDPIQALDFKLQFDATQLTIVAVEAGDDVDIQVNSNAPETTGTLIAGGFAHQAITNTDLPLLYIIVDSQEENLTHSDFTSELALLDGSVQTEVAVISAIRSTATLSTSITVYPNPAQHTAIINYEATQNQSVTIRLYDVTGKQVQEWTTLNANGQQSMDVSTLVNGIYIVEVETENGSLGREKLIVVQ